MDIKRRINSLNLIINRDKMILSDKNRKASAHKVNMHWWSLDRADGIENLGDYLAVPVFDYMRKYFNIDTEKQLKSTKHLYMIGSIIAMGYQNATIWGSGLIDDLDYKWARFRKLDIRAVRGPETRRVLCRLGYDCPEVYGDPGCLMPLIYNPSINVKKYDVSVILHHSIKDVNIPNGLNRISMSTTDYKAVIDEIASSKLIISGSLHGLILAEAYGVPAILLKDREPFGMFKYRDYYLSTGRTDFKIANSIQEAMNMKPIALPYLKNMQERLLKCFPVDLWK